MEDEDEVLLVMADQLGIIYRHFARQCSTHNSTSFLFLSFLGGLIELVGGGQFAHELLPPLEQLSTTEESSVREKACVWMRRMSAGEFYFYFFK